MARGKEQQFRLNEEIFEWREKLEKALIRLENKKRKAEQRSPLPANITVYISSGPNANLQLLNLKVWSIRYGVSIDFILEHLFLKYARMRNHTSHRYDTIGMGVPVSTLTGAASRKYIEEVVNREFPNQENWKALLMPQLPAARIKPFESTQQMLSNYTQAMNKARNHFSTRIKRRNIDSTRNFRRVYLVGI